MPIDTLRFGKELYRFRLVTLGVVAFLLPLIVPMSGLEAIAIVMLVPGALLTWGAVRRWMEIGRSRRRLVGLASLLEALVLAALVYGYGGTASPFLLLFVPLAIQAAGALTPAGALLAAAYAAASLAAALRVTPGAWNFGGLVPVAAVGLGGVALAWWAADRRRTNALVQHRAHRLAALRRLQALAAGPERSTRFWPALVETVRAEEGFVEVAAVRFDGDALAVTATHRPGAWRWLATQHAKLLRQRVETGTPEVFAEGPEADVPQAIAFVPVTEPGRGEPAALLGVLVDGITPDVEVITQRLLRWMPLARLALAAAQPHLVLHRAPVDWTSLVAAVVHRLDRKLSGYLVLIDVAEGAVAADEALLADAVAHLVEAALEGAPRGTRVHLTVRREGTGWRFAAVTAGAQKAPKDPSGLRLARQIVLAHGGRMDVGTDAGERHWGFRLPVA